MFVTRYLDLATGTYVSLYNTVMKLFFIGASGYLVYLLRFVRPFKSTYNRDEDAFLYGRFAVLPCLLLALFFNEGWGAAPGHSSWVGHFLLEVRPGAPFDFPTCPTSWLAGLG